MEFLQYLACLKLGVRTFKGLNHLKSPKHDFAPDTFPFIFQQIFGGWFICHHLQLLWGSVTQSAKLSSSLVEPRPIGRLMLQRGNASYKQTYNLYLWCSKIRKNWHCSSNQTNRGGSQTNLCLSAKRIHFIIGPTGKISDAIKYLHLYIYIF